MGNRQAANYARVRRRESCTQVVRVQHHPSKVQRSHATSARRTGVGDRRQRVSGGPDIYAILRARVVRIAATAACVLLAFASAANADDALQWSGFALLRATNGIDSGPLREKSLSSQLQLGVDWIPTPFVLAHVHLLGRTDAAHARRGHFGVAEAYVDANFRPRGDRLRLRGGAFFLPTSRENVDALWEPAYTITPSALNSWLGEELRPIGIDAAYTHRGLTAGGTLFRGNDTFGALPVARGWALRDHWITLGEWIPVDPEYFTSVSAENDHRYGWSARGAWIGASALVQLTHIDNRSDGEDYGPLFNWATRFDIAAAEYTKGDWTLAAEYGWGPTYLIVGGQKYTTDLDASYALVSRRWKRGRATIRGEVFRGVTREKALTVAWLWNLPGRLRPGFEVTTSGGQERVIAELRYSFSR